MSMILPWYLAMTASEFTAATTVPKRVGWMACHFSCFGKGLSNLPAALPPDSLLILNDAIPISGHDPQQVLTELTRCAEKQRCCGILLDFQRPNVEETANLCCFLTKHLPCPIGITEFYGAGLPCALFLSIPLHRPPSQTLATWNGQEIWLETVLETEVAIITKDDVQIFPTTLSGAPPILEEEQLFCHYSWQERDSHLEITLQRTPEDLVALLEHTAKLGVTKAIGLYQQLGNLQ